MGESEGLHRTKAIGTFQKTESKEKEKNSRSRLLRSFDLRVHLPAETLALIFVPRLGTQQLSK